MKDEELQDLLRRAGEISKVVPEALREAAFNRAVDLLTSGIPSPAPGVAVRHATKADVPRGEAVKRNEKPTDYLLGHLDRTSYPEVSSARRVLDRSLYLLRVARDAFGIDGLGAPDIARILTEKFRLRASRQAVQQALDAARTYVDKATVNGRAAYRIMNPGERYLDSLEAHGEGHQVPEAAKQISLPSTQSRTPKKQDTSKKNRRPTSRSRPGPRLALNHLLHDGYFNSVRRIAEIQQYLAHSRAHTYKVSELSPTLVRMVRDNALERNRASDGQYEYKRK